MLEWTHNAVYIKANVTFEKRQKYLFSARLGQKSELQSLNCKKFMILIQNSLQASRKISEPLVLGPHFQNWNINFAYKQFDYFVFKRDALVRSDLLREPEYEG